jgi:hypothetical protein
MPMAVPIAMSLSVLTSFTYDCAYGNNFGCTYWLCLLYVFEFACLLTDLSCKFALDITVPIAITVAKLIAVSMPLICVFFIFFICLLMALDTAVSMVVYMALLLMPFCGFSSVFTPNLCKTCLSKVLPFYL